VDVIFVLTAHRCLFHKPIKNCKSNPRKLISPQKKSNDKSKSKTGPPQPKEAEFAHSSQPRRDMAGPTTRAQASWPVHRATSLSEIWAIVAGHLGLVGAWQLMLVCRAACAGAKEFLGTLPGLVVCGGETDDSEAVSDVWRLDLASMRWEPMPALITARSVHVCCAVRGAIVVLGGAPSGDLGHDIISSVEMLSEGQGVFTASLPLSCGGIMDAATVVVKESDSTAGQVLVLGGFTELNGTVSAVHLVDLATGICTPQPNLLRARSLFVAARLPDGCVICAGGLGDGVGCLQSTEILEPPVQGSLDAAWTWRELPQLSVGRYGCMGCVRSDGRFAVLGGMNSNRQPLSSCEALTVGDGEQWEQMPPMHDARSFCAGAAVAGCIIVAGGQGLNSAEVFDEVLDRWLRLPYDIPLGGGLFAMGIALL